LFSFNDRDSNSPSEDEYYNISNEEAGVEGGEGSKLILVEPRAYSESQQIADHLKNRHTVVVNMKRVTKDQAKRIVDFLSGTVYAIGGDLQKIGGEIFLCTPKNMNVQGKITGDDEKGKTNNDIGIDF
jgi:cell division inhibitor SepF